MNYSGKALGVEGGGLQRCSWFSNACSSGKVGEVRKFSSQRGHPSIFITASHHQPSQDPSCCTDLTTKGRWMPLLPNDDLLHQGLST